MLLLSLAFLAVLPGCFLKVASTGTTASPEPEPTETSIQGTTDTEISETTPETAPAATMGEASQEEIINGFNMLLEENTTPDVLMQYIDASLEATVPATMTLMLEELEHIQRYYTDLAMEYLFEGDGQQKLSEAFTGEDEFIIENIDKISDINLRNDILKMFEGGFRFIDQEGNYYPIIDYDFLKKYSGYIDSEYNDYLNIMATESNHPYARDAGLTLSWEELADRMIKSEKFLTEYTAETPRKVEVGWLFSGYFNVYISGMDNTPTRDRQTNAVLDEVIQSYRDTIEKNPESEAARVLAEYLDELENNDFVLSDDIFNSLVGYLNALIKVYGLDCPYMILEQLKYLEFPSEYAIYGRIKLLNGEYIEEYDEQSGPGLAINLSEFIAVGDLDGDGINDAAAILATYPGGSGTFYDLYAIYNGGFYIYSAANIFLGNNLELNSIWIEDSKIYIDMVTHKEGDPACCPTDEVIKTFKLENNELIEL